MAVTCPNFFNKKIKSEFNSIIKKFNGTPQTDKEFLSRNIRNNRTGIDLISSKIAYYLWDLYEGDIDKIQNSWMYKNSGIVLYSLLSHTNLNGAIKSLLELVPNIDNKTKKEVYTFFSKIYSEISDKILNRGSITSKNIYDIIDSLAQSIVYNYSVDEEDISNKYKEIVTKYLNKINKLATELKELLGLKIDFFINEKKFSKIDIGITKEEFSNVLDEIGKSIFERIFRRKLYDLTSLFEKIKELKNTNELYDSEEFKEFVKYLREEENVKSSERAISQIVEKALKEIYQKAEERKINEVYLNTLKETTKQLNLIKINKKLNTKKIQDNAKKAKAAKLFMDLCFPILANVEYFNTILSRKVDEYARFVGTKFSSPSLDLKNNSIYDETILENDREVIELGYSDETLDYDKSHFEKELSVEKSAKYLFLGLETNKKNIDSSVRYLDPKIAFAITRNILSNFYGTYEEAIEILKKHTNRYSWLNTLIARLEENTNQENRNAFLVSMTSLYLNQYMVFYGDNNEGSRVVKVNDAAAINSIVKSWINNFISSEFVNTNLQVEIDKVLSYIITTINDAKNEFNKFRSTTDQTKQEKQNEYEEATLKYVEVIREVFKKIGINLSKETLALSYDKKNSAYISIGSKKINLLNFDTNNYSPLAIFINTLKNYKKDYDTDLMSIDNITDLYRQTAFKKLARKEIVSNPSLMPLSHTVGNKKLYSYVYPSYSSIIISKINSELEFVETLLKSPYRKNNAWLKKLKNDLINARNSIFDNINNNFKLEFAAVSIVAIQRFKESVFKNKKFDELHESEHELFLLTMMLSKITDYETNEEKIFFNLPITSDKSTFYGIVAPEFELASSNNGELTESDLELIFNNIVVPEIERMRYIKELVESEKLDINDKEVIANSLFYLTPSLNLSDIFDEDGFIIDDSNYIIFDKVKNILKKEIEKEIEKRTQIYIEYGLVNKFTKHQLKKILSDDLINKIKSKNPDINNVKKASRILARYVTLQSRLGYGSIYTSILPDYSNFFSQSAFKEGINEFIKDPINKEEHLLNLYRKLDFKQLIKGIKAIQDKYNKRAAMFIANGKLLNRNETVRYVFVNDKAVNSKMLDQLQTIIGEYNKEYSKEGMLKESTNAQEFITLEEYIKHLFYKGDVSEELYEVITTFYEKLRREGYKENYLNEFRDYLEQYQVLEEYDNIIVNPIKPVYNWFDFENITFDINPIYIKSSAYPILPEITSLQITEIRKLMEKNKIDRLVFPSGAKIGTTTKLLDLWDENGNIRTDINSEEIEESTKNLDRIGLREQQDIPFHGNKNLVNRSTQADKLAFIDLSTVKNLIYKGNVYTGKELETIYNVLYDKLYEINYNLLLDELDADYNENGKVISINVESLLRLAYEEGVSRGFSSVDLEYFSNEKYIPLYPTLPISDKLEALINSIVKNRIMKIKFPGNAFVLSTEEGYQTKNNITELNNEILKDDHVIYTDSFTGELSPGEYVNTDGKILTGKELEKAFQSGEFITRKPSQVLIPWRLVINGHPIDINYFIKEVDGKKYLDTSKIDPEVLKVFGFRIPNAGLNSMSPIEIVGFLPERYGDVVVASRDFLAQMGSDFDVDKLYTYFSNLYLSVEDDKIKVKILNFNTEDEYLEILKSIEKELNENKKPTHPMASFFNDISQVKKEIKLVKYKAIQSEIKEIHIAILTSPNRLVAYKNFIPTGYGLLKKLAEEAINQSISYEEYTNSKGEKIIYSENLISVASDPYHRKARNKANMGKNLVSIYALTNGLFGLFQIFEYNLSKYKMSFFPNVDRNISYIVNLNIGGEANDSLDCSHPLTIKSRKKFIDVVMKKHGITYKEALNFTRENIDKVFDYLELKDIKFRSTILGYQLQAAVDNQNQDILGNLNINEDNVLSAIALTLFGYEEDLIGKFFRIPTVKIYYDNIKKLSSSLDDAFLSIREIKEVALEETIKQLQKLYNVEIFSDEDISYEFITFEIIEKFFSNKKTIKTKSGKEIDVIDFKDLTIPIIDSMINTSPRSVSNDIIQKTKLIQANMQSLVLAKFLDDAGENILELLSSAKIDSNYFGSSFIEYFVTKKRFNELYDKFEKFDNINTITKSSGKYGILMSDILYSLFYNISNLNLNKVFNALNIISSFNDLNTYNYTELHSFLKSYYLISAFIYNEKVRNNDYTITTQKILDNLVSIKDENSFINKLLKYKDSLPNNLLLKLITIEIPRQNKFNNRSNINNTFEHYIVGLGEVPLNIVSSLIDAINELYSYSEKFPDIDMSGTEIVENLIKIFVFSNNHSGYNSLLRYVSPAILEEMGLIDTINSREFNDWYSKQEVVNAIKIQFLIYNPKYAINISYDDEFSKTHVFVDKETNELLIFYSYIQNYFQNITENKLENKPEIINSLIGTIVRVSDGKKRIYYTITGVKIIPEKSNALFFILKPLNIYSDRAKIINPDLLFNLYEVAENFIKDNLKRSDNNINYKTSLSVIENIIDNNNSENKINTNLNYKIKTFEDVREHILKSNPEGNLIFDNFSFENSNQILNIQRLVDFLISNDYKINKETYAILHSLANSRLLDITPLFIMSNENLENVLGLQYGEGFIQLNTTDKDVDIILQVLTHELIHQLHTQIINLVSTITKNNEYINDLIGNKVIFNNDLILINIFKHSSIFQAIVVYYYDAYKTFIIDSIGENRINQYNELVYKYNDILKRIKSNDFDNYNDLEMANFVAKTLYKEIQILSEDIKNIIGIDFSKISYSLTNEKEFLSEILSNSEVIKFFNDNIDKIESIINESDIKREIIKKFKESIPTYTEELTKQIIHDFGIENLNNSISGLFLSSGLDILNKLTDFYKEESDKSIIWQLIEPQIPLTDYFNKRLLFGKSEIELLKKYNLLEDDNLLLSLEDIGLVDRNEQMKFLEKVKEDIKSISDKIYVELFTEDFLNYENQVIKSTYIRFYDDSLKVTEKDIGLVTYKEINDKMKECNY